MSENDTYGEYSTEADQQIQQGDSLDDRGVDDILDEGYSPPEKWSVLERFGNTPQEEAEGESLDQRLSEEEPDPALAYDDDGDELERAAGPGTVTGPGAGTAAAAAGGAGTEDDLDLDSSIDDQPLGSEFEGEVGDERAGRLVSPDEGAHVDVDKDLIAGDVGIDGAAASAEEAAVHVVEDE
jgi:hypothetical protein